MKRIALSLPLALLLLFSAREVRAGMKGVHWVPTIAKAEKVAKDRGSLILVCACVDGDPANDAQKAVYRDPAFVKASRDFVCVYANPKKDHGTVEVVVDGKKVRRCADFPQITCKDHQDAWNEIYANYPKLNTASDGSSKFPFHFVLNADGKVLATIVTGDVESGFDVVPVKAFVDALAKIVAKYGKGLSDAEYGKLEKTLEKAEKAAAAKDHRKALMACAEIVKANPRSSLAVKARAIEKKISEEGEAELAKAEELVKSDPVSAIAAFRKVAREYAGTDTGKSADSRVAELEKDPKIKATLARQKAEQEAGNLLASAEKCLAAKQYAKALRMLDDAAKNYAGTPAGEKAKKRAAQLRADPAIAKALLEQKAAKVCGSLLSLARSYALNGMKAQARKYYQKVIDEFPGTKYAEQAKKELEKLK